ncbi:MAG: hypothetical protein GVY13_13535 [Alphaproteobacteria bacterium]|jgi:hemerythrin|nr:hypothetical protein [Alphaproteobacteria bacterium]
MENNPSSTAKNRVGLEPAVEAAHQLFMDRVAQYRREVSPKADDNCIAKALSDVIEAWRSVCAAENELIDTADVPNGREHVLEHLSLTASLSNIAFQFSHGERNGRLTDLPVYVEEWFAEHRRRYDRWSIRTRDTRLAADATPPRTLHLHRT